MAVETPDLFYWVGAAFMGIGYALSMFASFAESKQWGWFCVAIPPMNLIFAYIYMPVDRKPFFFYSVGISLWIITYLASLAFSTAYAAPWHGTELTS
jgi:hypothetical protein